MKNVETWRAASLLEKGKFKTIPTMNTNILKTAIAALALLVAFNSCKKEETKFHIEVTCDPERGTVTGTGEYLKEQKKGAIGPRIKWNFTKFLVAKDGTVLKRFAPQDTPESIDSDIAKALGA